MRHPTRLVATEEFEEWFMALDPNVAAAVDRVVGLLGGMGVNLPFPYSSAIKGARHPLRELRVTPGRRPIRVLYAFDPDRDAVLLIGGEKSNNSRFYKTLVPRADRLFDLHLAAWGTD